MPTALTPNTAAKTDSARKMPMGGSTMWMLTRFEQARGHTNTSSTNPFLVSEIQGNVRLEQVVRSIPGSDARDSVFRVNAELDTLVAALEKSTLKPEVKNALLARVTELRHTLEQAMVLDSTFSTLETNLGTLSQQRHQQKQARYEAIAKAVDPAAKAAELMKEERASQSSIEDYAKQLAQAKKLFQHYIAIIDRDYSYIRDSAPGSVKMKTMHEMRAVSTDLTTPATEQQPTQRTRSGA